MTGESWERVKEILHQAMQLAPEQRSGFLDEACVSDTALREEVESLLLADEDLRPGFLQAPPLAGELNSDANAFGFIGALVEGQIFAERFQLIRKLGEGGMGQVWLAEQTSPVKRQVALKLIKAGMYDESVVQRFQSERQSLAIMDHPAIAKVFDAGTTPQGQPYFVMEYVPGLPITEYCDQKKLRIADRLGLFIQGLRRRTACPPEGHHPSRFETGQHPGGGTGRQTYAADYRLRVGQGSHASCQAKPVLPSVGLFWDARVYKSGAGRSERCRTSILAPTCTPSVSFSTYCWQDCSRSTRNSGRSNRSTSCCERYAKRNRRAPAQRSAPIGLHLPERQKRGVPCPNNW